MGICLYFLARDPLPVWIRDAAGLSLPLYHMHTVQMKCNFSLNLNDPERLKQMLFAPFHIYPKHAVGSLFPYSQVYSNYSLVQLSCRWRALPSLSKIQNGKAGH